MRTTEITLPNGIVLPEGNVTSLELREMDGQDEDFIRDKDELRKNGALDRLLKRCIVRIGTVDGAKEIGRIYDSSLLLADVSFILVKLRAFNMGSIYRFPLACPQCSHVGKHHIDLDTLPVDPQKEEYVGKTEHLAIIDDTPVQFRALYSRDSALLETIKKSYPKERGSRDLLIHLISVAGQKPSMPSVRAMSWPFRNKLRLEIEKVTGGINTTLESDCEACGVQSTGQMPVDMASFFFQAGDTSNSREARPYLPSGTTPISSGSASTGVPSQYGG